MQVTDSSLSLSPSCNKYSHDDINHQFNQDFGFKLLLKEDNQSEMKHDEDEDEEFSFVYLNADGSPVYADDTFQTGQVHPNFPLFNQDLLKDGDVSLRSPFMKLFVEDSPDKANSSTWSEPVGPYCKWRRDIRITVEGSSRDTCKKSNSTGFCRLRRVRDLIHRSNSDGKEAFVSLNHPFPFSSSAAKIEKKNEKEENNGKAKGDKTASAHEKIYVENRAMRKGDKHRSYLTIRQVGFFTNVNGLSRNVHPF